MLEWYIIKLFSFTNLNLFTKIYQNFFLLKHYIKYFMLFSKSIIFCVIIELVHKLVISLKKNKTKKKAIKLANYNKYNDKIKVQNANK